MKDWATWIPKKQPRVNAGVPAPLVTQIDDMFLPISKVDKIIGNYKDSLQQHTYDALFSNWEARSNKGKMGGHAVSSSHQWMSEMCKVNRKWFFINNDSFNKQSFTKSLNVP